jgi:uncharacterized protein
MQRLLTSVTVGPEALRAVINKYSDGAIYPFNQNGVNSTNVCGDSLLHVAVRNLDVNDVLVLLESGADVNAIGDVGQLPINSAVIQGNLELTRLLFAYGSITDHRSNFGRTLIEIAKSQGWLEIESFLTAFVRRSPNKSVELPVVNSSS